MIFVLICLPQQNTAQISEAGNITSKGDVYTMISHQAGTHSALHSFRVSVKKKRKTALR